MGCADARTCLPSPNGNSREAKCWAQTSHENQETYRQDPGGKKITGDKERLGDNRRLYSQRKRIGQKYNFHLILITMLDEPVYRI